MASAPNGQVALSTLERLSVDVVVLDIEMPVMDGMTALPLILQRDPHVAVMMASTLTRENAAISLRCLQMGATECLAKPTSAEMTGATTFQDALVEKLRAIGRGVQQRRAKGQPVATPDGAVRAAEVVRTVLQQPAHAQHQPIKLRPQPAGWLAPSVIAISSSTGGPQALTSFFADLGGALRQPVLLTQHMPPTFTTILAETIARTSGVACHEAVDGETIKGGTIYVAPGNYHMTVRKSDTGVAVIALNQDAPENFCRPAADVMLRSLPPVYGGRVLSVVLTGMGADGLQGCKSVVDAGGMVYAQDEATSVVWGMPGAVAQAGICTQVLPLGLLGKAVRTAVGFAIGGGR